MFAYEFDLLPAFVIFLCHENSCRYIAVPVKVFGGRVKDDIGTEIQRSRRNRSGDGAVNTQDSACVMGSLTSIGNIDNIPGRIDRCLHPYDSRFARYDRPSQSTGISCVE